MDAGSAHETGTEGLMDPEQLAFATSVGRAIVTCDHSDFIGLARRVQHHAGIILSYEQCSDDLLGAFAGRIERLLSLHGNDELRGALIVLDAFR